MDFLSFVFGVGDRVTGWGEIRDDRDGLWFDPPHAVGLPFLPDGQRPRRSSRAVRLLGADPLLVATRVDGDGSIPGWAMITGTWLGDSIQVQAQSATPPPSARRAVRTGHVTPPCPPPPGDWPAGSAQDLFKTDLKFLIDADNCVSTVMFRPRPDSVVMVVVATNTEEAEAAWRPVLGPRLCIVRSRWTKGQLDQVRDDLVSRWEEWTISAIGGPIAEDAQRSVDALVLRVMPGMAAWARDLPDGLFHVTPTLRPDR